MNGDWCVVEEYYEYSFTYKGEMHNYSFRTQEAAQLYITNAVARGNNLKDYGPVVRRLVTVVYRDWKQPDA